MNEFRDVIQQRIHEAYESLESARSEKDDFLIDLREGELARLRHIAAEHDIAEPVLPIDS